MGGSKDRTTRGDSAEGRLAELSRHFLALRADVIDHAVREHLEVAADMAGADRTFLVVVDPTALRMQGAYAWSRPGLPEHPMVLDLGLAQRFAWTRKRLVKGLVTQAGTPEELPDEAEAERAVFRERGTRSTLLVPVRSGDRLIGGQLFETVREERRWSEQEVSRLRLLGEIFASAIKRKHSELALRESEARFRAFAENAMELVAEFDREGAYRYASPSYRDLLGHDPEALIGRDGHTLAQLQRRPVMGETETEQVRHALYAPRARLMRSTRPWYRLGHITMMGLDQLQMMLRRTTARWASLLLLVGAGACSVTPVVPPPGTPRDAQSRPDAEPADTSARADERIGRTELTDADRARSELLFSQLAGDVAAHRGAYARAAEYYTRAAQGSGDAELAQQAAQAALLASELDQAEQAARLWQELAPETPGPYQMLAAVLLQKGDRAGARAALHRLLSLGSFESSGDYLNLARLFSR